VRGEQGSSVLPWYVRPHLAVVQSWLRCHRARRRQYHSVAGQGHGAPGLG